MKIFDNNMESTTMANKQVIFADRLVALSVHNGLVRLDLGVAAGASKSKEGKPVLKLEATHQLILPIDSFAAAVEMQGKFVKELVARQKKGREAKADAAVAPQS